MVVRSTTLGLIAATVSLWTGHTLASDPELSVTSFFNPAAITLGQTATYSVTVEGTRQPESLALPNVDGLDLTYIGSSQNVRSSIVNGQAEYVLSVSYNFRVFAERTGEFIIPAYTLKINGQLLTVPKANLKVLPPDGKTEVSLDEVVFLELECPEEPLYVGQMTRCVLNLFVLTAILDARYDQPVQNGDAFSQGNIDDKTTQTGERRNDMNYQKVSRAVSFTPLKTGRQKIEYELLVEITLPRQRTRSHFDNPFDRFFRDDFFGFGSWENRRQLKISTGEVILDIRPLPEEGKPAYFTGAIGLFSIKQNLSVQSVKVGDPLTLEVEIFGKGNFERIQPFDLKVGDHWKSYTPKADFMPLDALNDQGTKTFTYVLIPKITDMVETPAIQFSFFDPKTARYIDLSPPSLPLKVNPASPAPITAASPPIFLDGSSDNGASLRPHKKDLLGIKILPGTWVAEIRPPFRTPAFLAAQIIPLFLLTGVYLARRRQLRLRHDASYARRLQASKSMRKWLQKARMAAHRKDTLAFYASAHRAIQESLGQHFKHRTETLTLAEIEDFLRDRQAASELIEGVGQFFQTADAIKFAGRSAEEDALAREEKTLLSLLTQLTALR